MSSNFLSKDIIYVNSKKRISGTSDNFTANLSGLVRSPNNYDCAALLNFSCPKSYYLFNNTNNKFKVTENLTTTITIPIGNYNITTLISALMTLFSANLTYTYIVTFIQQLGKIQFVVSNNGEIQPIFDFTSSLGCEEIIGFENDTYSFVANNLTSVSVVNLQLTNTIQLLTDLVVNNVLANIVPNSGDFTVVNYNEQNPDFASHFLKLNSNGIQAARFWLLDGNSGLPLDLNGLEFNFSFVLFKSNGYYEKILDKEKIDSYIELQNSQNADG